MTVAAICLSDGRGLFRRYGRQSRKSTPAPLEEVLSLLQRVSPSARLAECLEDVEGFCRESKLAADWAVAAIVDSQIAEALYGHDAFAEIGFEIEQTTAMFPVHVELQLNLHANDVGSRRARRDRPCDKPRRAVRGTPPDGRGIISERRRSAIRLEVWRSDSLRRRRASLAGRFPRPKRRPSYDKSIRNCARPAGTSRAVDTSIERRPTRKSMPDGSRSPSWTLSLRRKSSLSA